MASLNSAGAPWAALLAQGSWTLVLLMLPGSSFASLLDYFGPASWCFYALSSSALIKLRFQEPHAVRPYKVPLYPLPPLLVIGIAIMVVTSSLLHEPLYCSLALGFVALSIPVHSILQRFLPALEHGQEQEHGSLSPERVGQS
jgi:basic amino acid/polyamine antiporter, APA family